MSPLRRSDLPAGLAAGAVLVLAAAFVIASLKRPQPPEYAPTPPAPAEVGDRRVGPITYTVDASDGDSWRFFDFSRGSVVRAPGPREWDVAFRRFHIIANGGDGFAGRGGLLDLGTVGFDSVRTVPASRYSPTTVGSSDSTNAAIAGWYEYGFTSHLLTPRPRVYAVRTADGRYAKIELLSYYCTDARAGCITFRYVYQGGGSRRLVGVGPPRS